MEKVFRWGLLGPGMIAARFAEALESVDSATLAAVASRNGERAKTFARRFGCDVSYDNYQSLYESDDIDAIYISTPHRFHYEQIKACLLHDKPVLCEKPLTVNAAQSRELFDLAKQRGVFLVEGMWSPHLPAYRQIGTWQHDGVLGDIKLIQSSFGFKVERNPDSRLFNHDLAGGVLLDMGIYCVAMSRWLMGAMPSKIHAQGHIGPTQVDESVSVSLEFGDHCCSQFQASFEAQLPNALTVCGTEARLRINDMFWEGESVTLCRGQTEELFQFENLGRGFKYEIEHAMACIREGSLESPLISSGFTTDVLAIMDEIRRQIGLRYRFE